MTRLDSILSDATNQQHFDNGDLDAYLIDHEFDDFLDSRIAFLDEALADFRNA